MFKFISIDPGKYKCGLVLAGISEKKIYKAEIKSNLISGKHSCICGKNPLKVYPATYGPDFVI